MIHSTVYFTGLEIDPTNLIQDRCIRGIIPTTWERTRFFVEEHATYHPISDLNRWLADNVEGRWAAYIHRVDKQREIVLAFENVADGFIFKFADGMHEAFKETNL